MSINKLIKNVALALQASVMALSVTTASIAGVMVSTAPAFAAQRHPRFFFSRPLLLPPATQLRSGHLLPAIHSDLVRIVLEAEVRKLICSVQAASSQ